MPDGLGRELIGNSLVERHSTQQHLPSVDHARAEDQIRPIFQDRQDHFLDHLRRILPVTAQKDQRIEVVLDRIIEADFLIPAVSLVVRIAQHGYPAAGPHPGKVADFCKGLVCRMIVDNRTFRLKRSLSQTRSGSLLITSRI